MNLTDNELITEIFNRAMQSDIFCVRLIKACKEFIKQLENN